MEFDAGIPNSRATVADGPSMDEDPLWQMNLRSPDTRESGTYPVREGEPECTYYIRTGLCRFGSACRFNHPPNRKLAIATAMMKGEYPERIGQPECQYYLKTATCKFGATCKFHHPKDKAGIVGRVPLNLLGYPIRPTETECAYYLRTGQCKFGNTCKFDHPQPFNMTLRLRGPPGYPPVHSPTIPGQQSYPGGIANWPLSRAPFIPRLMLPQGLMSVPGWNTYSGRLSSVPSSESLQQMSGNSGINQLQTSQRENVFPERPGLPECQFYMKTGDCKFGAVCRFDHPRERLNTGPDCNMSTIGLPLHPGAPLCIFYSRYGICKFGPSCKFDHPMGAFTNSITASSSADDPVVRRLLASSSGTGALALSSEGRLSLSESRQMPSGDDNTDTQG